jgi:predicted nucleic acid-binding protein
VIVVDTSVWIEAQRRPGGRIAETLKDLIENDEVALALPVRLELVAGVSRRDRTEFVRALSALPLLRPTDDTWKQIETWVPAAADKGHRFGIADWLIAALADEIGALIWSLDEDFAVLDRLKMAQRYDA